MLKIDAWTFGGSGCDDEGMEAEEAMDVVNQVVSQIIGLSFLSANRIHIKKKITNKISDMIKK